jgi:hypothetical protein
LSATPGGLYTADRRVRARNYPMYDFFRFVS